MCSRPKTFLIFAIFITKRQDVGHFLRLDLGSRLTGQKLMTELCSGHFRLAIIIKIVQKNKTTLLLGVKLTQLFEFFCYKHFHFIKLNTVETNRSLILEYLLRKAIIIKTNTKSDFSVFNFYFVNFSNFSPLYSDPSANLF